ncbi:hypothetical protein [Actinobacillus ureae]|uniref:hypothetical protein n=1 Tax=Actinobacillus ureae TaxID=723 RepID=UPI001AD818AF|nr:hypothetical protein [Actinobacillus ureae]
MSSISFSLNCDKIFTTLETRNSSLANFSKPHNKSVYLGLENNTLVVGVKSFNTFLSDFKSFSIIVKKVSGDASAYVDKSLLFACNFLNVKGVNNE